MIRFTDKTEAPAAKAAERAHRFAVGAAVMYRANADEAPGLYLVMRCLPEKAGELQYRIKSDKGGRERGAGETSLSPADAPASSGRLAL